MENTKVVCIYNADEISAFNALPPRFKVENTNYYIHKDHRLEVSNSDELRNYDLLITGELGGYHLQAIRDSSLVYDFEKPFVRLYKSLQCIRIKQIKLDSKIDLLAHTGDSRSCLENRYYLIKPELGARSDGTIFVDTKYCRVSEVVGMISASSTSSELAAKLSAINDKGYYFNYENEATIKDFTVGTMVVDYNREIGSEYRVITGHDGRPVMCLKRDRVPVHGFSIDGLIGDDDQLKFATGVRSINRPILLNKGNNLGELMGLYGSKIDDLNSFFRAINLPLHSFDLFVNQGLSKWGVFEYCPQFGNSNILNDIVAREAMYFIHKKFNPTFLPKSD